ncbi:uncharacterized protein LOC8083790 [Sorghum bicolor]|uniref:uncharacterized protein LOC8083790 n=1 Tax=Sorghum bicolor TaxID=4558 RepID=UPI0001A852AE|nr:uncharacterized protein LOC8083790 [Sorghum bicolor]|eukprot:XP_021303063.1 uncharacterized protein LOC8083790 [Sorghum bicolor]
MAESNSGLQHPVRERDSDLDVLLQQLEIREDEEQDIVLEEDLEELKAEARWTALAKVCSSKTFSHAAFIANMKYAWSLAKDVSFKAIEENLFVLKFSCLGDWRKVMDEGPWIFRGHAVLLEEYDGITKPSKVRFKYLATWVRIYDLPTGFRTKNIGRQLGNKIGDFLKVDLDDITSGWRDFLRIRVKLDVEKPLTRIVYISLGGGKREAFRVKYEKLPRFCAVCGFLGHVESECGDGVHEKKELQYGDWLIASPERKAKVKSSRFSGLEDTKGLDSRDSIKPYFERRFLEPKSGNSSQRDLNDLVDDGTRSPLKRDSGRHLKSNDGEAKKSLTLHYEEIQEDDNSAMALVPTSDLKVNLQEDTHLLLEDVDQSVVVRDGTLKERSQKRLRIEDEKEFSDDIDMRSAGSLEEYRREK